MDITPQARKADQISASRTILPRCEFHRTRCETGLDGLIAYEYAYNEDAGTFSREPLHNWASHPADAFHYGAQVLSEASTPPAEQPPIWPIQAKNGSIFTAKLDDLWEDAATSRKRERI